MKLYSGRITFLPENGIFVFGSNTQGRHGKGAALIAKEKFGAKYGQPRYLQGKSYGICTKDLTTKNHPSIPKDNILNEISILYDFAKQNPNLDFYIAYKGRGKNLNGYTPQEMADMFSQFTIPSNIIFEKEFFWLLKIKL